MSKEYTKDAKFLHTVRKDADGNEMLIDEPIKEIIVIQKRHYPKGTFFMETLDFAQFLLDKDYGTVELKLILALKRRLEYNNRIRTFRQKELAEEIKSSQPRVSHAFRKLVMDGVVLMDGHDYYFSPKFITGSGDGKKSKRLNEIQHGVGVPYE